MKPTKITLHQNYPNPFNPVTEIQFDIAKPVMAKLSVYDVTERQVALLVDEMLQPGRYSALFDATGLTSGEYIYKAYSATVPV